MNSPAVTVLMTVFNARPYLSASVRSILDQSFRDFEFLIIDDGSTDGSGDDLRAWAQKDPRVRVMANARNSGQTPCLNQGIAEARGAWIARQDADDISHPERLEKQMRAIAGRPALALLGSNGWLADEAGRYQGLINAPCGESAVRWTAIFSNPFLHTAVCFRTADARRLGGYDPAFRIAQDYDLWLRINAAAPADNLPDRLVTYRVHAQSLSNAARDATRREGDASCRRALASAGLDEFDTAEVRAEIGEFREGLPASRRRAFWRIHKRLLDVYLKRNAMTRQDPGLSNAIALLHWKAAGSLASQSRSQMLGELAAAFTSDPALTVRLLRERRAGPR